MDESWGQEQAPDETRREMNASTIGRDAAAKGGDTYCERCGHPNDSSAIYCKNCGEVLNLPE